MRERKHVLVTILKSCRLRSGISQRELARTANVPDHYIRDLEDQEELPKRDPLFHIAFALYYHMYKKEKKEAFSIIHEICEVRREIRYRLNKLRRRSNNSDARRLQRLSSLRF